MADNEYDNRTTARSQSSLTRGDPYFKKKSAAHHEMFNSSQAPWGIEQTSGSVPQIKRKIDPDEMPAAGKKTVYNPSNPDGTRPYGDVSVQELQNELS